MSQKIFLAGAAGAIGRRLVPLLVRDGHRVFGTTRSTARVADIEALGATPLIVDVFDADALVRAVREAEPDIVIHQLTDLSSGLEQDPEAARRANARLRREGTANLVGAAIAAGAGRFVAQSIAWAYAPGPTPYTEDAPLDVGAEGARHTTIVEGVVPLERAVLDASGLDGIVLRYGQLYGPGTWTQTPDGASPLHVDAAASAAALAIDHGAPGVYNIADEGGVVSVGKAMTELGWSPAFRLDRSDSAITV
ncbi:NAD-dependent epimerase/dehydratase family protein [Sphingomonas morindae]|uniref:NAD(P)-dependent oxidoreductase n=1 Tax=Sphingomonas morindae TaxID=1541170 RepID=A0ABY4X3U3_9SPHN|nr:NAD(P)-dependent oxidoreductase [Sphingomonas morindae]USI71588.1 NAD(P)-dependent oxidoreductase [Sphingomonas morindae]